MAGTLTTNNSLGMGYQTGFFSGPLGEALNQTFFDAAFAGQLNTNKILQIILPLQYHSRLRHKPMA